MPFSTFHAVLQVGLVVICVSSPSVVSFAWAAELLSEIL